MNKYVQVITTTKDQKEAVQIGKMVVESKLAACAQILGPIQSVYRWKGSIQTAEEWICLIKSKSSLYNKIEKRIRETHSYQTPEIIAVPIVFGSRDYLLWIGNNVSEN